MFRLRVGLAGLAGLAQRDGQHGCLLHAVAPLSTSHVEVCVLWNWFSWYCRERIKRAVFVLPFFFSSKHTRTTDACRRVPRAHTHTHIHARTHRHTHLRTHTHTHTHTHTQTHTHTAHKGALAESQVLTFSVSPF